MGAMGINDLKSREKGARRTTERTIVKVPCIEAEDRKSGLDLLNQGMKGESKAQRA